MQPAIHAAAGNWLKTKGPCRFGDDKFNTIANDQVTDTDECKALCISNSKCDVFDMNGKSCYLFQDQGPNKHTGNGDNTGEFCYVRSGE